MKKQSDTTPATQHKRVLFLCSGNYYRSRLAEILFNHEAAAAGIPWVADSRGMLAAGELKGMSEHAASYLKVAGLDRLLAEEPRDPLVADIEDLTGSDLVVGMCREEHKSMVEQKFLAVAKAMHKTGRLRYWHVYDIPGRPPAIVRLLGGGHRSPSQPARSGTEHIALAIKALVEELKSGDSHKKENV
jgi:protein-tyrosine phosphatase